MRSSAEGTSAATDAFRVRICRAAAFLAIGSGFGGGVGGADWDGASEVDVVGMVGSVALTLDFAALVTRAGLGEERWESVKLHVLQAPSVKRCLPLAVFNLARSSAIPLLLKLPEPLSARGLNPYEASTHISFSHPRLNSNDIPQLCMEEYTIR